jgi:predicted flavoprotein YhiN
MLFTHRGLSGPAILQISSYWREARRSRLHAALSWRWRKTLRQARRQNGRQALHNALAELMPKRLAQRLPI